MAKIKKVKQYTKVLPLRLSLETWAKIQGEAAREKLAPSTWIRQVLEKHLNHR